MHRCTTKIAILSWNMPSNSTMSRTYSTVARTYLLCEASTTESFYHHCQCLVKSISFVEVSTVRTFALSSLLNVSAGPPCQGFSQANRHPVSQVVSYRPRVEPLTSLADSNQMTRGRPRDTRNIESFLPLTRTIMAEIPWCATCCRM